MKTDITLLIVDDEEIMRDLLSRIFAKEGYQLLTAVDGQDALDKIKNNNVNIILSDMNMPNMNGFELLKHVHNDYPSIKIIIMTAYGDTYTVKDSMILGADEYITKPFNNIEIKQLVERTYWRLLSDETQPA